MHDAVFNWNWYELVGGDKLLQGDILFNCIFVKPYSEINFDMIKDHDGNDVITAKEEDTKTIFLKYNIIILSQSCDINPQEDGGDSHNKYVLVAPVYKISEFEDKIQEASVTAMGEGQKKRNREYLRKGWFKGYHVLNKYPHDDLDEAKEYFIVDFHDLFTLDIKDVRRYANSIEKRLRLLPPYREQLANAFGGHISRVALPDDKVLKKELPD